MKKTFLLDVILSMLILNQKNNCLNISYWFMKTSPVLNDKLIRKQSFWYLDQFWQIGIDEGTWFLKFTIILDKTEDQKVKKYEKLDQNSCLVLLFHPICLLDSQEYVMWVFQKSNCLFLFYYSSCWIWTEVKVKMCANPLCRSHDV